MWGYGTVLIGKGACQPLALSLPVCLGVPDYLCGGLYSGWWQEWHSALLRLRRDCTFSADAASELFSSGEWTKQTGPFTTASYNNEAVVFCG